VNGKQTEDLNDKKIEEILMKERPLTLAVMVFENDIGLV